ncbi:MAG: fimbria major subunit [Muribaculaceae bacterium]|nr:fimbria major subunit [Muribaculaceae bacterium]
MKNKFFYGLMAATGLLFAGCSSEELITPDQTTPLGTDQTFYVSMTIRGDVPTSRVSVDNGNPDGSVDSNDFAPGTEIENQVNSAYFVFYDEDGNVVGDIVSVELGKPDTEVSGNTVEKSYKNVVSVAVRKGEKAPAQVICYINPIQSGTLNVNLNTIQTVARSNFSTGSGDKRYFAMSNAVYYPNENDANCMPRVAVQIPSEQLYESETEAEAALKGGNTTEIYVERYATKLTFEAVAPEVYETATRIYAADGSFTVKPITLEFLPQCWAVNAQANRNYVIKSFHKESDDGILLGDNYTYSELNGRINSGLNLAGSDIWDWNNPDYHRSYWGMSPAYFTAEYPEVSQDVMDGLELNQTYISYNELLNSGDNNVGISIENTAPQYFRETTVGRKGLESSNPAAAVASVIYVGTYAVSIEGQPELIGTNFYTYLSGPVAGVETDRPYVYFDDNGAGQSAVAGGESILKRFLVQSTSLFKKSADGKSFERFLVTNPEDYATLVKFLTVDEISNEVKIEFDGNGDTKLKLRNNARTLQFKDGYTTAAANAETSGSGIYVLTGNGYQEVVSDDVKNPATDQIRFTQANLVIMRQVGYAYFYTSGHAYFNIPVKHLGWYRKGNLNRYTESGALREKETLDWNKVRVGDFGMVRNHSYSIQVESILGLAPGIGGDDVPIVPPSEETDYFVAYTVNILKWAVVPTQSVKL